MNTIVNERSMDFADFISEGFKIFFFRIKDFSLLALSTVVPLSLLLVIVASGFPSQDTETNIVKIILLHYILGFLITCTTFPLTRYFARSSL